jgi:hypothetical protein
MKIEAVKFDKDTVDSDGVGKATRDFWNDTGTSQLLFSTDSSTSQGLLMSIKSDEEVVFSVLTQIERWLNRYLKFKFNDLMYNVDILHVTRYNQQEMYEMYLSVAQYGVPVKNRLSAVVGLDPIETMNMAYLENDILKMHEEFVPLFSSNTMSVMLGEDGKIAPTPQPVTNTGAGSATGASGKQATGRPAKKASQQSDETARAKDKPNA